MHKVFSSLLLARIFSGHNKQDSPDFIPIETPYRAIARRTTLVLFIAQCLGSAGFLAVATVSSIVGRNLIGSDSLATVPEAIYQLGVSFSALGWGYGMDRLGRRGGLTLGILLGALGAWLVTISISQSSLALLIIGLMGMGIARSALQLARFAAAEVHRSSERARAISNVVLGGTAATFIWAGISNNMDFLLGSFDVNELSPPYLISALLFVCAAVIVFLFLRPDPRDIGREIMKLEKSTQADAPPAIARSIKEIFRQPAVLLAVGAMVLGQVVMVMIMIITPLHMRGHQHALADISLVISSHVFGMYAFSILSGRLADRFGRIPVIMIGAATLMTACLTAPLSPDILPLGFSLFLLGLGWNFCFVGGSTLLADQLVPQERSRTQGFNDLLIGLVSAAGSLGSGLIYGRVGYGVMGMIGAITAGSLFGLAFWRHISKESIDASLSIPSTENS